ncbi:MAG: choice-of-anchor D domain-containing protein [Actinomycetes bacterium]
MRKTAIGRGITAFLIFAAALALAAAWSASSASAIEATPSYDVYGLSETQGVAVGNGFVYVTAASLGGKVQIYQVNDTTRTINDTGTWLTVPDVPNPDPALSPSPPSLYGITVDSAGTVYAVDRTNSQVSVFAGGSATPTAVLTGLSDPVGVAVDSTSRVYVTEYVPGRVQVFQPSSATPDPLLEIRLLDTFNPASVAVNSTDKVYVGQGGAAGVGNDVAIFNAGVTTAPGELTAAAEAPLTGVSSVFGLAFDPTGRVYASNGGQVAIFEPGVKTPNPTTALGGLRGAGGIARTSSAPGAKTLVADRLADGSPPEIAWGESNIKTYLPGPMATLTTSPGGTPATGFGFEPVSVGSSSTPQVFTITNTGGANLVFNSQYPVTLSNGGVDNSQFAITANTCTASSTLVPGAACTFTMVFSPQGSLSPGSTSPGLGLQTVAVELRDNEPITAPQHSYSVTGTGVTPVFGPPLNSAGQFGAVELSSPATGPTSDITITNTGTGPLTFGAGAVALTGTNADQFTKVSDGCSGHSVFTGMTCKVQVQFKPTSQGPKSAALTFADNALYADPRSPQTFALSGTGVTPVFSPSPATKNFVPVEVDGGTATQVFTITNPGSAPLTFGAGAVTVSATGDNVGQFTKTADTCSGNSVASGSVASCTVTVTFDPSSVGAKSASLHFVDNAAIAAFGPVSPQDLALSGTGVTPGFSPSMAAKNFGDVRAGPSGPTPSDVITITNSGTSDLVFSTGSIAVTGTDASRFTITANTCATSAPTTSVAPGSTCAVTVRFTPGTAGAKAASLDFLDNATVTSPVSPQHIALSGKGVTAAFSATMTTRDFGNVGVEGGIRSEAFDVTNTGDLALTFAAGSVTITGADTAAFTKTGDTCGSTATSVAPGAKCTVSVQFDPSSRGVKTAALRFVDNSDVTAPTSPQSIPLTGKGVAPAFSAATPSSFGGVAVGSAPTKAITVTNAGDAPLIFGAGAVVLGGADASQFAKTADTCTGQTVAASGTCTVTVAFSPTTRGAKTATVVFTDNATLDGNTSPQSLPLTGTGLAPVFSATVPSAFGNAVVGVDTPDRVFNVTNTGDAPLVFAAGSVTVTGTDAARFAINANTCSTAPTSVAAGASCAVTVRFTPGSPGLKGANLGFTHNAAGSPNSYALTGFGTTPVFKATPATKNFGAVGMGALTPAAQPFTIKNDGDSALTFAPGSIAVAAIDPASGASVDAAARFTITANTCLTTSPAPATKTLAPSEQCVVTVRFSPTTTDAKTAKLHFVDNATVTAPTSPQDILLAGTGRTIVVPGAPGAPTGVVGDGKVTLGWAAPSDNGGDGISGYLVEVSTGIAGPWSGAPGPCATTNSPATTCAATGLTNKVPYYFRISAKNMTAPGFGAISAVAGPFTPTAIIPEFSPSLASIDFGDIKIGPSGTTPSEVITITNSGNAALNFETGSITVTGANAGLFTITANTCSTAATSVAPGGACAVKVRFAPGTLGAKTASLDFVDNATIVPPVSPQHISLSGKGVMPAFSANLATRDFGDVGVIGSTQSESFDVTNSGDAALTFGAGSITITGADASEFTKASDTCTGGPAGIAPGTTCTVTVDFDPGSRGVKNATLRFVDNADVTAPTSPQSIPLTGKGVAPTFSVAAPAAFGNAVVGVDTPDRVYTVTNTGDAPLTFAAGSVAVTGTNFARFTITANTCSTAPTSVAPGTSCAVTVRFTPGSTGDKSASLGFTHNAPESPNSYALTGRGITPVFTATPSTLGFNEVGLLVDSPTHEFTIKNDGEAPLTFGIGSITVVPINPGDPASEDNADQFTITANACLITTPSPAPKSLAPGAECKVAVRFTPSSTGVKTANLHFVDNAGVQSPTSPQNLVLSGTGINTRPPAQPTGLGGVAGNGSVSLSWTAPTDTGGDVLAGYLVEVATNPAGSWSASPGTCATTTSTATSCSASGLSNGTAYYFRVSAKNSTVPGFGATSAVAGPLTPTAPYVPPVVTPPAAQVASCAKFPAKIKKGASTIILRKVCKTNAGQVVRVSVAGSGAKVKTVRGVTTVTTKSKKITLTLTFSAPAVGGYAAFYASRPYKIK